jgi:predicted nucleic acid-binding protein
VGSVLVDAGPLVALIDRTDRSDRHHETCKATLQSLTDALLSAWPVVTEAMYVLAFSWRGQDALWDLIASQVVALATLDHADAPRLRDLMHKYRDLPMDLADAALVRVAERERLRRVFTLDRRHFALYRPARLGRFVILP